jgi:hypothetical protein
MSWFRQPEFEKVFQFLKIQVFWDVTSKYLWSFRRTVVSSSGTAIPRNVLDLYLYYPLTY